MPIKIPRSLPAKTTLEGENIFVITQDRAAHQDIRPLKIVILNLMPKKIETETQLLRLLGNSPLQIDIDLLQTVTHVSKNTNADHLLKFYKTFREIQYDKYDGLIVTGAPVELMEFEQVDYWEELCRIFKWAETNVYSSFHICWGAQAALYYYYGIPKLLLPEKMFGVFPHAVTDVNHELVRGFDEIYYVPHSRHTTIDTEALKKHPDLEILSYSEQSGINMVASRDNRRFFVCGHSEYDRMTLAQEYFRDLEKGDAIQPPCNYFPDDNPDNQPPFVWRGHANLLFHNWLNIVYQQTPYDLNQL